MGTCSTIQFLRRQVEFVDLPQRFPVQTRVEVLLPTRAGRLWTSAVVVDHAPPAVWVQTSDGRRWFVTHGGRIREADA